MAKLEIRPEEADLLLDDVKTHIALEKDNLLGCIRDKKEYVKWKTPKEKQQDKQNLEDSKDCLKNLRLLKKQLSKIAKDSRFRKKR